MVEVQVAARGIRDARVLAAMATLPRHMFVPAPMRPFAYEDRPLPIGFQQTISQPFVVGWMTEALELQGDERVLEVGTGSGYQAALLSRLTREVFTVERIPELARRARWLLNALGCDNVHVVDGDGSVGLPNEAPYDCILVAAATPAIPDELMAQLGPRGRLVAPVGSDTLQSLRVVKRTARGGISVSRRGGCIFVPLLGARGFRA